MRILDEPHPLRLPEPELLSGEPEAPGKNLSGRSIGGRRKGGCEAIAPMQPASRHGL